MNSAFQLAVFFNIFSTGLCYLRVKVASWRYQRGCRSLALSLSADNNFELTSAPLNEFQEKGDILIDDFEDIPPIVEEVVGQLLKALRDEDITTRFVL